MADDLEVNKSIESYRPPPEQKSPALRPGFANLALRDAREVKSRRKRRHIFRSTIIFLISAISLAGLSPFGQAFEQFMMV